MLENEFHFKPSKIYLIILTMVLLTSVIIVVCLQINLWWRLLGLLLLLIYGGNVLWQFGLLRGRDSVVRIRRQPDGKWLVQTNASSDEAELKGDSTVTGVVSILRFKITKRFFPMSCVVFRDSLAGDHYRKLLVLLKMT